MSESVSIWIDPANVCDCSGGCVCGASWLPVFLDLNNGGTRDPMLPYQSAWMSHWMQTSCDSASRVHNHIPLNDGGNKDDQNTKQGCMLGQTNVPRKFTRLDVDGSPDNISEYRNAWRSSGGLHAESDVSQSAKGVRVVMETERVEMRNKKLAMKSMNFKNVRSEWQSFPMFNFDQKRENILASKKDPSFNGRHVPRSQIDDNSGCGTTAVGTSEPHFSSRLLALAPTGVNFSLREHHSTEGISQSSAQLVKPCKALEKKSLLVSRTLQDDQKGSTSKIMPYGFESRGAPVLSFMCRNKETDGSTSAPASNEYITETNFAHYSTILVHDKKMDSQLTARSIGSSHLGQKDGAQQLHVPSTSDSRFPNFTRERGKRPDFSGSGYLPSHSCSPGVTKSEELNYGCHSLHRMPSCSVHDVETLRICTTVDSVEGVPGGFPQIFQTTHHFLITKKTGINLPEGGKMFRRSSNFKGDEFHELLTLPADFGCRSKRGAKLQPLANSMDSEEEEDVWDVRKGSKCLKNESSVETDRMDVDVFQARNSPPGVASYPSNKDVTVGQNPANSQATMASLKATELPDKNKQTLSFSAETGTMENRELSTSRTESLDLEHLLSHVEQPENSSFSPHQDSPQGLEPDSRWLKRLKLSASDILAHGTKSSKMGNALSSGRVNTLVSKIINYSRSSSEHTLGERLGKGQADDKTVDLIRNRESSSMDDSVKECLDLSHSWIRRWCHIQAAAQRVKPAVNVVCEPQSSKAALDEFQSKQFPSIAAMALMGKAMSDFQPCEFRKRGSFVVWNTKGF